MARDIVMLDAWNIPYNRGDGPVVRYACLAKIAFNSPAQYALTASGPQRNLSPKSASANR